MTSPFGSHTLAYGVHAGPAGRHVVARVGDLALDLAALRTAGLLEVGVDFAGDLGPLLAAGPDTWAATDDAVTTLARRGREDLAALPGTSPVDGLDLVLPFAVADYVDFYSSLHHATNLGRMFRPDEEPLLPHWRQLPIGYHGRAGTVVVSGTDIPRPSGLRPDATGTVTYGPSLRLDIELEVGFVVGGPGTHLGQTVAVDDADRHVFGVVVVNDWSARDIQAFEYRPLGPFLGKSFATSVSAWVTPLAALRGAMRPSPAQVPTPAPHLVGHRGWALDLDLEVAVQTATMRAEAAPPEVIARVGFADLYWTFAQQLAHLTSNGATLRPGDLFASGTVSGPEPGSEGSLIERSWNGARPFALRSGETRSFLEDDDRVVLRASSSGAALGHVDGTIRPGHDGGGAR